MEQHELSFQFKARYYKSGEITNETKQVWFVLHGYGQLAQFFIRKFDVLKDQGICVVAPEGLSRFYLQNFTPGQCRANDRVGATWMTKENRLMDIDNYINYLNALHRLIVNDRKIRTTILGFSQGSATACRWAVNGAVEFDRLILWAGMFPPDMNFQAGKDLLKNKEVVVVYGNKDPFLKDELFQQMKDVSVKLSKDIKEVAFDGEHDIDSKTLLSLM